MSVCTASASVRPAVCPGFTPCNPNQVVVGDSVSVRICIDNNSEQPTFGSGVGDQVTAELRASTNMEVFLGCKESRCNSDPHPGILQYVGFTPTAG